MPTSKVDPWKLQGTTTVEVTMNGVNVGRRSLKRWDDRGCWFIDLADAVCRKANVETGDRVKLSLKIGSEELPEELAQLIKRNSRGHAGSNSRLVKSECCAKKSSPPNNQRRAHDASLARSVFHELGAAP